MDAVKDRLVATLLCCTLLLLVTGRSAEAAISCYTCSSRNGSDVNCEDPFHPAMSDYKVACMVPKEGHIGKFPANFCVKVTGLTYHTGERLVIRTCTLENMENQCGAFRYESESLTGCVLTCNTDGCNAAERTRGCLRGPASLLLLVAALHRLLFRRIQ